MFTSMIIILIWEITSDFTGALNVPEWLDNIYRKTMNFWEKIFF